MKYTDEEWRLVELNRKPDHYTAPDKILGPLYPDLGATVAKFRRKANQAGSVKEMLPADRRAYADAIEKAIRAKHRTLHMKPNPSTTRGWYNPPSITRLLHYENPIKMQGDPDWRRGHGDDWRNREEAVYAHMMKEKAWRAFSQAAE